MSKAKEIRTEIVIQASPSKVWSILTDFKNYSSWNPFIKSVKGNAIQGKKITARIEPPGASGMTFRPKILTVAVNQKLSWLGHLFIPGLFDGEHIFELYENSDGSTTFVQRENFTGILVPLFKQMLDNNTLKGFEQMNKKLKAIAEGNDDVPNAVSGTPLGLLSISLLAVLLISTGHWVNAQRKFANHEISINGFRNPSIGIEYRYRHFSIHAGYYPTNFESGATTSFIRSGVTYWFFPVGKKENPSSFYSSLSYARGLDREYKSVNALITEVGFRWMVWKGLNVRLGVAALQGKGQNVKINPTPGISYAFLIR